MNFFLHLWSIYTLMILVFFKLFYWYIYILYLSLLWNTQVHLKKIFLIYVVNILLKFETDLHRIFRFLKSILFIKINLLNCFKISALWICNHFESTITWWSRLLSFIQKKMLAKWHLFHSCWTSMLHLKNCYACI